MNRASISLLNPSRIDMRLSHTLLSAVAISTALAAQTNNEFWNYASTNTQNATTFTSRYGVAGADTGYVYKGFTDYRAIGNPQTVVTSTNAGEFVGFTGIIQDQLGNTPENYEMFVTLEDAANPGNPPSDALDSIGGFASPSATVLGNSGPLGTTTTPPSTASTPVAWRVTFTSATPIAGIEADQSVWIGFYMSANAAWTGDGVSAQGAWYTAGTTGENPNSNAPANSWFESIAGGVAGGIQQPASNFNNPHFGLVTFNTVFEVGADIDPTFDRNGAFGGDYGIAGRYPQQQLRNDGMGFRITDNNSTGLLSAVLLDVAPLPVPAAAVPGIPGYIPVIGPGLLPVPVASGTVAGGVYESIGAGSLFPFPNPFPLPTGSTVGAQAVVLDFGTGAIKMSNGVNVTEL